MILNQKSITESKDEWIAKGYKLPAFDRDAMIAYTKANPEWIHFGAGNIFRAFQANLSQKMLEQGSAKAGLTVAEGYDYEIIEKQYRPQDELSVLVTLKSDGAIEKTVIGSIAESLILDSDNDKEFGRLKEIFTKPSLKMATFTITEKGYVVRNAEGALLPAVEADVKTGPEKPGSYIGKVASLLYARFKAGALPIAMVSTDNCSHNGDKLYAAIEAFAEGWESEGVCDKGFKEYINDRSKVSFPWSMIDKITPRPDPSVEKILTDDGLSGVHPEVTSKGTFVAPFVNAEESEYLVIEDAFPNGRPALEKVGVIFTQRETVDKVERMKVCTCLNPLHTALAVMGCLLGFTRISDEMKDPELKSLVEIIGYKEGLPVVTDPGVIDPKAFIDTVLGVRVPNPFMPDTPQRIATDTSQKIPIRFGETIKAYMADSARDVNDLKLIPLVLAGWLRYLTGIDDNGEAFELSSDPLLDKLKPYSDKLTLGAGMSADDCKVAVLPLLEDASIFGVSLTEAGLADRVCGYLSELLAGPGAVRDTLRKYASCTNH